ncbi:uncharacterized protein FOMMEDRAFT_142936 [Fomitiporia mediterranea MF3/22]|uniref:uncharacterized protein n=1 Tax=Fomitiporia mediterranea (strain MF3/22) TaxID=694068 RepID=UPI00044073AE|nr:uncharacterized protein FOMMEDRAFT_142936 [Fomitiporia mediterranea MF3/22]EJC98867.1 hypothetical protein FOMMEDRAFT_142936 [Fomitiporia mediterranea MF3/22]
MADNQDQMQHTPYHFVLDGTGIPVDSIDNSPHGHPDQIQSNGQGHDQNQAQMSPLNSANASATHPNLMYHPYAHPHHPSFASTMHQGSPNAHMGEPRQLTLDPAHLRTSSVGPSRVITRRQARMAAAHSNTSQDVHAQQRFDENFALFSSSANSAGAQTPSAFQVTPQLTEPSIGLPDLQISQITIPNASALSPQHPSTPTSVTSSNFSHYGFPQHAANGHSRSASSSTNQRSTSPAASVVSAATSLSSGSNPASGCSRPPVSSSSTRRVSVSSYSGITDTVTSKPKRRLQNRQRKEICQYYLEHPNSRQEDIAARWGVERSTVSKILKRKNYWMACKDGDENNLAKHRPPKFGAIEAKMESWLAECRDSGTPISDAMIRVKAREIARSVHISEDKFKASAGWIENFKHRLNIKKGQWLGLPDPGSYTPDDTDDERPLLADKFEEFRRKMMLQNVDEQLRLSGALGADIAGPGMDLGNQSTTLDGARVWGPTLGFSFGNDATPNASNIDGHINGMANNANRNAQDPRTPLSCQTSTPFTPGGNLLQHHVAATQSPWLSNSGSSVTSFMSGTPNVSTQEANSAMETLLRFLQMQPPELLSEQIKNTVMDIKHIIWASGRTATTATTAVSSTPPNGSPVVAGGDGTTNPGTGTAVSGLVPGAGEPVPSAAS